MTSGIKPSGAPSPAGGSSAGGGKAKAAFENFSPSHRREYVEWISEAKRDETKAKRVAQAFEWIADGKSRNWKYQP